MLSRSAYKSDDQSQALGIVILTSPFDWLFAKGAIASCRYFMPSSPIQLIVDGDVDVESAKQIFCVNVLRSTDVAHPELKRLGFGWGTTKLLSFWYSQTSTFLYIDSDAVLWGDLSAKVDLSNLDYLVSVQKSNSYSREEIQNWFFEINFVESNFPDFDWHESSRRFFCPGVFAARKNAFQLESYLHILRLNHAHPGKFKFGDMGFHNLMVFRGAQHKELRVGARDFQVIFPEFKLEELEKRFAFTKQGDPIVNVGDENVLHMPDQKPLVDSKTCYSRPMTYFRLQYLEKTEGISGEVAMARLRAEDEDYHRLRAHFLRQEKRKKIANLFKLHPGEWRRLLSKILKRYH